MARGGAGRGRPQRCRLVGPVATPNRSGSFRRRKFIKLVITFTDVKWKQAAKLVDKLPSHVVRRVRRPQAERFRVASSKSSAGSVPGSEVRDEPPETQFDRDVKFLENQKKQRRSKV